MRRTATRIACGSCHTPCNVKRIKTKQNMVSESRLPYIERCRHTAVERLGWMRESQLNVYKKRTHSGAHSVRRACDYLTFGINDTAIVCFSVRSFCCRAAYEPVRTKESVYCVLVCCTHSSDVHSQIQNREYIIKCNIVQFLINQAHCVVIFFCT